jgi:hypothetical protein
VLILREKRAFVGVIDEITPRDFIDRRRKKAES